MPRLVRWPTVPQLRVLAAVLAMPLAAGPASGETRIRSYTPGLPGTPVSVHVSDGLRQAAQAVAAAVVTVRVSGADRGRAPAEAVGFVVDPQGYVVTTDHALRGGGFIEVTLGDGRTWPIVALSRDPVNDLAVLKIEATGLPALPLGSAAGVRAGDLVLAARRGAGPDATVGVGVITVPASPGAASVFQSDLILGPESAGTPLVNARGEVVGVVTAGSARSGGAIPIDVARPMLQAGGGEHPSHWLGLSLQPLTHELARSLGVAGARGVLVAAVERGSPAARAGLRPGDVIIRLDGQATDTPRDLEARLARLPRARPVELAVIRDGAPRALRVGPGPDAPVPLVERLGLGLEALTPEMARRLGVEPDRGVVVRDVQPDSPAARAGIAVGDLIREVNGVSVDAIADVERATGRLPDGRRGRATEILLRLERNGAARYVVVDLG